MSFAKGLNHAKKSPLDVFAAGLRQSADLQSDLSAGIIGKNAVFETPFGPRRMVYADYVASGRALRQVEGFVMDHVLPYYANSHTEASFTGGYMTRLREQARDTIVGLCGGTRAQHAAIFAGSGATAALNKLVHLFGIRENIAAGTRPHVLVGPYEHHSNLLPWRESNARVIEIAESPSGGPDLDHLEKVLAEIHGKGPIIGSFSAASNVTGIPSDTIPVIDLIKAAGGKIVWDYAGGAPYLDIDMRTGIDAVAISAHKFLGGPGASGLLIVRRDAVTAHIPSHPGGGTVAFVNDEVQDYSPSLEEREEGGTPNIIGDIRAALVMIVKDAVGQDLITKRNAELARRTFNAWKDSPHIQILAADHKDRLPIFSFIVRDSDGQPVDYTIFTRMLSDIFGIQARGGCACAGPYVHRLLSIDREWSARIREKILTGDESDKPGFIRLNFSYLMTDAEVDFVHRSVLALAENAGELAAAYPDIDLDMAFSDKAA